RPVSGWNQCVKCVAPFSMAQSFIAAATTSATIGSRAEPWSIVRQRLLKTFLGRRWRMTRREKTSAPKISSTRASPVLLVPACPLVDGAPLPADASRLLEATGLDIGWVSTKSVERKRQAQEA